MNKMRCWRMAAALAMTSGFVALSGARDIQADFSSHWSGDSRVLAVVAGLKGIEVYAADGTVLWTKKFDFTVRGAALSPDGSRLAYVLESLGLWILDVKTGVTSHVHAVAQRDFCFPPQWSPDGRQVILAVIPLDPQTKSLNISQRPKMFLVRADGTGEVELNPQ